MTAVHALAMEAAALSDATLFARLHDALRADRQELDRLALVTDPAQLRAYLAAEAPVTLAVADPPRRKRKHEQADQAGGEG